MCTYLCFLNKHLKPKFLPTFHIAVKLHTINRESAMLDYSKIKLETLCPTDPYIKGKVHLPMEDTDFC